MYIIYQRERNFKLYESSERGGRMFRASQSLACETVNYNKLVSTCSQYTYKLNTILETVAHQYFVVQLVYITK